MMSSSSPVQLALLLALLLAGNANAWLPTASLARQNVKLFQSSRTMDGLTTTESSSRSSNLIPTEILEEFSMDRVGLSPNLPQRTVDVIENPREFTPFQQFARVAPLLTVAAYAVNPAPFDGLVQTIWDGILSWDISQTGLFEAHVATFAFVAFISAFSVVHLILGEEEAKKWRLDGDSPQVNPLEWATPEGFLLWFNPIVGYLGSIWIYQQVFHTYTPPPLLAPTFGALLVEVVVGVFLYDLCFAPIHIFMHRAPIKEIRGVHGFHHRHTQGALNPVETVQHTYIDATLQVMVNILVQHISPFGGPKHVLSRLIHNIIVTYMLTESHSGYNLPWMTHNIWPEFLGGSPRHERHHKDGRVYYQQFFTYMDDALGFTDQDVQEELVAKKQLRKMEQDVEVMTEASETVATSSITKETISQA